jgi:hypothetical protein
VRFAGFIGPSYTLQTVNYDCQRTINLFPQINEIGTGKEREVASFLTTPGLTLLQTLATDPIRGIYVGSNNVLYVAAGNKVYSLSDTYVATELGTLLTYEGNVSFADNGITLAIVDGVDGYGITMSSGSFAVFADPDFKAADKVVYQDGYFIFNEKGTGRFFISELNSIDFEALEFATAEGNPDNIISIISDHRDLWLLGTQSVEVFYNSGNADFPFERIQGAFIEHGCAAPFSVCKMNNEVYWIGADNQGNGVVYKARGYQPQRVSTHAVELAIRGYGSLEEAVGYTYQENGHYFYVLNFAGAPTSWVYDASTNLWHERAFTRDGNFERHRANYHAFFNGKHIVGDYENGKIYEMSTDVYTDFGEEITRQRAAPHITSGLKRVFYNSFQLDMEVGVGLDGDITTQGHDPQVMLQFSDDGGHSWSNEKWVSFGKIGKRLKRAIWRRLGYSRDRVFRITITDPVKVAIIGAEMDVMEGAD